MQELPGKIAIIPPGGPEPGRNGNIFQAKAKKVPDSLDISLRFRYIFKLLNFDEKGSPSTEKRGVINVVNAAGRFPEVLS